jgi:PPOX class probable F420-dependent enzyme
MAIDDAPGFRAFWTEHLYSTLTTFRPDGTPHVVPVSVTYEPEARIARVVSRKGSRKVRNIVAATAAAPEGARVALCQVDRGRWATLEGRAVVRTEAPLIADAEDRYEARYGRRPAPNPERVLIEITVDRTMGRA